MAHSPDLVWFLVRKNTSFLVKRDGIEFSRERNNLRNLNCFRYSGLAQNKTVGLSAKPTGARMSLKSNKAARRRRPAKAYDHWKLNKDFRRVARTISTEVGRYRPDLKSAALARWTRIHRSLKGVTKKTAKTQARKARKPAPTAAAAAPATPATTN